MARTPALVALVAAALALPALASAAELPRVLVLEVRTEQGVTPSVAKLLGELLLADVHASGRYGAIGASDLVTLLDVEQRKQVVGCASDTDCLSEIGAALGADLILDSSVGTIGARRVLSLKLIDVRAVQVRARETETVDDDDALIEALHRVAARVLGMPGAPVAEASGGVRPGWFVAGGGVLLAAGGAVLGGLALSDLSAFEASPFDEGRGDAADGKAAAADGLFIAGGVALVAGLTWLLIDGALR